MKNNLSIWTGLLLAAWVVASCSSEKKVNIEPVALVCDTVFNELSDSSFIPSNMPCVDVVGEDWYFSDYADVIVVLDKNFKVKKRVGVHGEGPGELQGTDFFYAVSEDSIYVFNDWKRSFELFVNDRFAKHISFAGVVGMSSRIRFFAENREVYHFAISDKDFVTVLNEAGEISRTMCGQTKYDKPDFKFHSTRHVVKGEKDTFFLVGYVLPIFQMYSLDGTLLQEYDLMEIPQVKEKMDIYNETPQTPNSCDIMIQDVYYRNNKLYLLVVTGTGAKFACNTLCVLDVADKIEHIRTFQLPGRGYDTFCVSKDDVLVAYNTRDAALEVFSLKSYLKQ